MYLVGLEAKMKARLNNKTLQPERGPKGKQSFYSFTEESKKYILLCYALREDDLISIDSETSVTSIAGQVSRCIY
jgi:hypothetical protein